jgi:hypothetical protein
LSGPSTISAIRRMAMISPPPTLNMAEAYWRSRVPK